MKTLPYVEEILSQPEALLGALPKVQLEALDAFGSALRNKELERIVITGMGGSLFGAYPAWLILSQNGLAAIWIDAAELLHHARQLITPNSLLWIISQSGKSAELIPLLDKVCGHRQYQLLATTNDIQSPLAKAADVVTAIHAPVEKTVSTRTYINTLAVTQLVALRLSFPGNAEIVSRAIRELEQTGRMMSDYLKEWESRVSELENTLQNSANLVLLGRGPSMAAVWTGALILAEAAKKLAVPMNAAEFRHGPLELAGTNLTALVFEGREKTQNQNRRLVRDLNHLQSNAFLICAEPEEGLPCLKMPRTTGAGLPLGEILPIQLLTIALARSAGIEPGKFFFCEKVTSSE